MKTLPVLPGQAASSRPSPVEIWQILLSRLLDQHYGLTLNDTPFADERVIERKRLVRTVLIFTESSDQLSRATDRVPGLPASPGYVQ